MLLSCHFLTIPDTSLKVLPELISLFDAIYALFGLWQNKYKNCKLMPLRCYHLKVCLCVRGEEGRIESMLPDTPYIHLEPGWHVAVCLTSGEGLPVPFIVWHKGVEDGRVIWVWHWEDVWALSRSWQCDVWRSLPFLPLPTENTMWYC